MTFRARAHLGKVLLALALAPAAPALSGCASVPKEIEDLRSADQEDRIDAAIALSEKTAAGEADYVAAKKKIVEETRRLLDDPSALVRQVAIDSLARLEGRAAAGPIADRLRDRDPWVRFTAAKRLGALEARTAAEPLADLLLKDESEDVRRAAAQALAAIKARSAVRPLYLALQDDKRAVRYNAYLALRAITGEDHGEDPKAWRAVLPRVGGE